MLFTLLPVTFFFPVAMANVAVQSLQVQYDADFQMLTRMQISDHSKSVTGGYLLYTVPFPEQFDSKQG